MPGPEARALRGKTMRHRSFLGPGGQAVLSPRTGIFRCRGARPGARAARPILRKPRRISGWNSFPADAFSAQSPLLPGHKLGLEQKKDFKSEGGQAAQPSLTRGVIVVIFKTNLFIKSVQRLSVYEGLTERDRKVLQAIIRDYIQTAQPVGSRVISKKYKMGLSPATIRMSWLTWRKWGFCCSPIPRPGGFQQTGPIVSMWTPS